MNRLAEQIRQQNQNRKRWVENETPENTASMILEEAEELVEAISLFDALQDAEYQIISEVGDIGYLLLKFCDEMGIDLEKAIELKVRRNSLKYPDVYANNGLDYDTSRAVSRDYWKHAGGDHQFFVWDSTNYPPEK